MGGGAGETHNPRVEDPEIDGSSGARSMVYWSRVTSVSVLG